MRLYPRALNLPLPGARRSRGRARTNVPRCTPIDLDRIHRLANDSATRVLRAASADGRPLLPPAAPKFDELIGAMAGANLARAWAIEPVA